MCRTQVLVQSDYYSVNISRESHVSKRRETQVFTLVQSFIDYL